MKSTLLAVAVCHVFFIATIFSQPSSKPVWPVEFDAPFGLYNLNLPSPLVNVYSHFYYNYDELQSQVISYPTNCIPIVPIVGFYHPCALYFNDNGTYFSQPDLGIQCCSLFPGVGATPPQFLAGFTWSSNQTFATDYYGVNHVTNYWVGTGDGSNFAYWTDLNTNHDIFINDGSSGIFWSWGKFTVGPQSPTIFQLPGTSDQCNKSCLGQLGIEKEQAKKQLSFFTRRYKI